ncbi:diguanylate cyclase [Rhodoplanes sp. TEM]|uniref:diguanylate cyclase n=1 Tax=Rhodoplanes tepidamans TaxID=200616 RepID=A0ABT5JIG7_RHOTP|nr:MULTISPECIES: diguanylate cyclase [Rhodoplanes]MDC7789402.1 diguanylate cyclase [Rhodoplanes tepidamans]MDC7986470.1 diguanylate cyclase [Rhodoplanes sp. TEM]MDQ0358962.1 diguanylate cyclase (GGDEF)-like protein [Rhodoplanes tepidamans]
MDGSVVRVTLSLIAPGILFLFGMAFLGAWLIDRSRPYLLVLAGACAAFTLGAVSQILWLPAASGPNAMLSGALYTTAVLMAAEGILSRAGKHVGWGPAVVVLVGVMALLGYFFYVDRNLLARVYIQNFGYGLVFLVTALRLTALARGRVVDRLLFWILLVFALHFVPRTVLTIGVSAPQGPLAFAASPFWQTLQLSLALFGVGLALTLLAAAWTDVIDDMRHERDMDALTGVFNRRGFEDRVAARFDRRETPASLLLCDLDHFKKINDTLGHAGGDAVLRQVGRLLRGTARRDDVVGRLGGEEFAVFLPGTRLADAYECAERLRTTIAQHPFALAGGTRRVTASFGVAEAEPDETWDSLCRRADLRLYESKRDGRDRTTASAGSRRGTASDAELAAVARVAMDGFDARPAGRDGPGA